MSHDAVGEKALLLAGGGGDHWKIRGLSVGAPRARHSPRPAAFRYGGPVGHRQHGGLPTPTTGPIRYFCGISYFCAGQFGLVIYTNHKNELERRSKMVPNGRELVYFRALFCIFGPIVYRTILFVVCIRGFWRSPGLQVWCEG